ncbi:uncharacterized protein ISCGN_006186 [Ixodes scapularis]
MQGSVAEGDMAKGGEEERPAQVACPLPPNGTNGLELIRHGICCPFGRTSWLSSENCWPHSRVCWPPSSSSWQFSRKCCSCRERQSMHSVDLQAYLSSPWTQGCCPLTGKLAVEGQAAASAHQSSALTSLVLQLVGVQNLHPPAE